MEMLEDPPKLGQGADDGQPGGYAQEGFGKKKMDR
jgi:hypothetical protein